MTTSCIAHINYGGHAFAGDPTPLPDWQSCLDLCESYPQCAFAIYTGTHCYPKDGGRDDGASVLHSFHMILRYCAEGGFRVRSR